MMLVIGKVETNRIKLIWWWMSRWFVGSSRISSLGDYNHV